MRKQSIALIALAAFFIGYVAGVNNWLREYECTTKAMPWNVCTEYKISEKGVTP